jgi:hypothetical protein
VRTGHGVIWLIMTTLTAITMTGSARAVTFEIEFDWFRPWIQQDVYLDPATRTIGEAPTGWSAAGAVIRRATPRTPQAPGAFPPGLPVWESTQRACSGIQPKRSGHRPAMAASSIRLRRWSRAISIVGGSGWG